MWGIVPAAGRGSRIQPLGFSKELLPVGSRTEEDQDRPCAVSEYLVERMIRGGADKICFVISPGKSDIVEYFGGACGTASVAYVVQPEPVGLCDAIFRALPLIPRDEPVLVGLPDTVWFPEDGLADLPDRFSFLLFPVDRPELFDAVVLDGDRVTQVQVKTPGASSNWIWGAFKMPGPVLRELHELWLQRDRRDEYVGTLVNAYLAAGGEAVGIKAGDSYVDVGTLHGYRAAIGLLQQAKPTAIEPIRRPAPQLEPAIVEAERIRDRARRLGPWFHNLDLNGVKTAPDHFLGDYPAVKWQHFREAIPADLSGKSVLDIGCNGGFYSIEMKRRGAARVLGIDFDDAYLEQARFAAEVTGQEIEFRHLSVYDVAALGERFDIVLFMGVLYHLRHPLLALDLIREHVVRELFVFQSMQRGSAEVEPVPPDCGFWQTELFDRPGFPKLHFVEHRLADDPTNWWIPNRACTEAMLRSAGFEILTHPEDEVYVCRPAAGHGGGEAVYPVKGRSA